VQNERGARELSIFVFERLATSFRKSFRIGYRCAGNLVAENSQ
jgi:hypothetical protein